MNGTLPQQSKGTNLEMWDDDGSPEFAKDYQKAESTALGKGEAILAHLLPNEEIIEGQ